MFLSKKLLFKRWQPRITEYYWTVSGASSASLPYNEVLYAGPTKIVFCNHDSKNYGIINGNIGSLDLTTATPTLTTTPGVLTINSSEDGDSSTYYSYGYAKISNTQAAGFYVYRGVIATDTGNLTLSSFDKSSYPVQNRGLVHAVMVGDTTIWTTASSRTVSSSQGSITYQTCYVYKDTTLMATSGEGRTANFIIRGKLNANTVMLNLLDTGYLVTTGAATSQGGLFSGFCVDQKNYSMVRSTAVNTPDELRLYSGPGAITWTYSCYGGTSGTEAMFGVPLGIYKGKFYIVIGPKNPNSTTNTLELVELDATNGNELHRMTLPTPKIISDGVMSAYSAMYASSADIASPIKSKNGYFAITLTESSDYNGYINNNVGYHNWLLIKVPE